MSSNGIVVRRLRADEVRDSVGALADVLFDCVDAGASVSFMDPFTHADAVAFFAEVLPEIEGGTRMLLAAYDGDALVGTVQMIHAHPPNQPHRGDIAKLLVRRSARGRGVASRLMEHVEADARSEGKTLLVLDTVTGSDAERLYTRLGWQRVGVIPDYALYPDGRLCDTTVFWKRI
jgi:GNAT superfamily N-acetyltransferase